MDRRKAEGMHKLVEAGVIMPALPACMPSARGVSWKVGLQATEQIHKPRRLCSHPNTCRICLWMRPKSDGLHMRCDPFSEVRTVARSVAPSGPDWNARDAGKHSIMRNPIQCRTPKSLAPLIPVSLLVLAVPAEAAPVTFWFSGQVDAFLNPVKLAPAGIAIGTPFDGRISYDPANVWFAETNNAGNGSYSQYNFSSTTTFSFSLSIGGNTITNVAIFSNSGLVGVENNVSESDRLFFETSSALMMNGTNVVSAPNQVSLSLFLQDGNSTALSSTALPLNIPVLGAFSEGSHLNFVARNGNGTVNLFSIYGTIDRISATETVQLLCRRASISTIQLAWPLQATGYTLQFTTSLANPNWQPVAAPVVDTASEHTVSLPSNTAPRFFRLKK